MKKNRNSGDNGEEDGRLWRQVTRSVRAYASPGKTVPKARAEGAKADIHAPRAIFPAPAPPARAGRAAEKKRHRGQLPLDGRLDLHGLTQADAHAALHRFIQAAVAQEKKTVLVITGKGRESAGILKKMLPLWLEDPALHPHILAVTPAQPKDGGGGAFYVRLRKRK